MCAKKISAKKSSVKKSSVKKPSVKKQTCITCAHNFLRIYEEEFPNECPETMTKYSFGRHKWKVLRMMSKNQLLVDYRRDRDFGWKLTDSMSKTDILRVLKTHNGLVRENIVL